MVAIALSLPIALVALLSTLSLPLFTSLVRFADLLFSLRAKPWQERYCLLAD
ncbi:hypothetical protein [Candidatus Nitrotoga arctica]|uniref:Uncharacterized protein n=1 Tax=Candidatus Nitrotoga arctica TaxID=453162 RepID=A0ABN8AJ02_9PROT|nr:hypothetical protein [Candidatus Nitrotoga arctica]CAG9931547.1 protein of unknown function [Candidatus Nitrotoga arctica]